MKSKNKLPKLGFLYLDYVLRFFNNTNFKGWPDKIEEVVYHWGNDKDRLIKEIKRKKIEILIGNIPATAYETFKEIAKELPNVRFVPSIESQFANKSKENVTRFCEKYNISHPHTKIFYDIEKGIEYLKTCEYPKIIKRSYGASNYGGYYVHKVDDAQEAISLMQEKKYNPIYVQNCIPLKGDIRVMLIGHKPVCAFWRYAGEGMWITNTSQGGTMSYDDVPMGALELAVQASKSAKAEYWACDIAEHNGKFYILECATAFAAFSYIRDWIGQYLMWDFSDGRFPKPTIPLYNWEQLGRLDSSFLRTLRHISFSKPSPSSDGTAFVKHQKYEKFAMEKAEESLSCDVPSKYIEDFIFLATSEQNLPSKVKLAEIEHTDVNNKFDFETINLTTLLSLQGMEEEVAIKIMELIETEEIKSFEEIKNLEFIDKNIFALWVKALGI